MKQHFHTFDAFRFLAFFKVFLLHLPIASFPFFTFIKRGGGIGVIFFFVLSGFLITYVILEEKNRTGKLNLSNFFMRRVLRIWPLYYLMILFAFVTPYLLIMLHLNSSGEGYSPNWWMSLTFLENYKMMLTQSHPNVSPLGVMWSLCIEEHFYVIWGLTLFFIKIKHVPVVLTVFITISFVCNALFVRNDIDTAELLTNLVYFSFGAIPAYWLIVRQDVFETVISEINIIYKFLFILLILAYVIVSPNINYSLKLYLEPIIWGILFSGILCLVIPEKNVFRLSDRNVLSRLGIYTYGLYMYHTIVVNFLIRIFQILEFQLDSPICALLFVLVSLVLTIFISIISYKLIEKPFLKLKVYFYNSAFCSCDGNKILNNDNAFSKSLN